MWKVCAILVVIFALMIGGARHIGRRFVPIADGFPLPEDGCWDGLCPFGLTQEEIEAALLQHPRVLRDPPPVVQFYANQDWQSVFRYGPEGLDPLSVTFYYGHYGYDQTSVVISITPSVQVMTLGDLLRRAGPPEAVVMPGHGPRAGLLLSYPGFDAFVWAAWSDYDSVRVAADDQIYSLSLIYHYEVDPRAQLWHGLGVYPYVAVECEAWMLDCQD